MDPVTFQLAIAGAAMGLQAINTLTARRADMTPEQQGQADAMLAKFQGRITAAQQMVAPYVKEAAKSPAPAPATPTAPTADPNAGG